jgi:CRISPR system Cascade subunit CasC
MNSINPFKSHRIEFHILQSFPVTCLNRDDVGAPKTAMIGGNTRARVSSQCWKRQVRLSMQDFGVKLGIRSKRIANYIAKVCIELGASEEASKTCGEKIAETFSNDTLFFFSEREANALAEHAFENDFDASKLKDTELQRIARKMINPAVDGLDIALFGRMVAQAADLNVEAAASFSHAISTHKVSNEVEFFTALDDLSEEPGSAHMGSLEFNSATYYRYVSLDLCQLWENLGGENLTDAVSAFTKALFVAVPSARQTTQSGASPWEFAKIYIRKGQRLQVPFETAVRAKDGGFLQPSIAALAEYLAKKEVLAGSLFGKEQEFTFGEDSSFNIDHLVDGLQTFIASR